MQTERPGETRLPAVAEPFPIQIVPSKALLFAVADLDNHSLPQLLGETPEAVQIILAVAYARPDIIEIDPKSSLSAELGKIRSQFPGVIFLFSNNNVLGPVLDKFPSLKERLAEEREIIGALPLEDRTSVFDIELILKFLMEDGSNRNLTIEDYNRVRASHEVFGGLATELMAAGPYAFFSKAEQEKFTGIGQNLLRTVRLFEINLDEFDPNNPKFHEDTEKDFQGRVTQLTVLRRIITAQMALGNVTVARNHRQSYEALLERAFMNHPDRYEELKKRFSLSNWGREWVEHPGAPELTKAEATNFLHGGNG